MGGGGGRGDLGEIIAFLFGRLFVVLSDVDPWKQVVKCGPTFKGLRWQNK